MFHVEDDEWVEDEMTGINKATYYAFIAMISAAGIAFFVFLSFYLYSVITG